jgi:hypothetical protein
LPLLALSALARLQVARSTEEVQLLAMESERVQRHHQHVLGELASATAAAAAEVGMALDLLMSVRTGQPGAVLLAGAGGVVGGNAACSEPHTRSTASKLVHSAKVRHLLLQGVTRKHAYLLRAHSSVVSRTC